MTERQHHRRGQDTTSTLTKAVPHIRLAETNACKLAALDALAPVYQALCQQYVTYFCTEEAPDKFHAPVFVTPLSERWHRVAIQQAAGIARSWRTNREQAYQSYLEERENYQETLATTDQDPKRKEPEWKEWNTPTLRQTCIQANANVAVLEVSNDSTFDYWLRISTLEKGQPIRVPAKLADYHRAALHGKLRERQKRDREKRRRKARLRACLKKKGVEKLPSTSSKSGQRLRRHV